MKPIDKAYIENILGSSLYTIEVLDTVTSTNTLMKQAAQKGEKEFAVIIAAQQTAGKGRLGRSFYSPDATGLYMSILLRPDMLKNPLTVTTDAAVSCAYALERLSGEKTCIKWVNDIYMRGRKVCGILTEASLGENGYAVLGIGVNITSPAEGFPDDIKDRAGSVYKENAPYLRERTAAEILREFMNVHTSKNKDEVFSKYREKSMVIGKEINLIKNDSEEKATALSIDDDYSLVVRKENGEIVRVSSGDVSIRI